MERPNTTAPGRAMARFGANLANTANQVAAAYMENKSLGDAIGADANAWTELNDLTRNITNTNDYDNGFNSWESNAASIYEKYASGLSGRARTAFDKTWASRFNSKREEVKNWSDSGHRQVAVTGMLEELDKFQIIYADENLSDEDHAVAWKSAEDLLDARFNEGLINEQQRRAYEKEFQKGATIGAAQRAIQNDPYVLDDPVQRTYNDTVAEKVDYARQYIVKNGGVTDAAAAAAAATFLHESAGMQEGAHGDKTSGNSYGYAQWNERAGRFQKLKKHAESMRTTWQDRNAQLSFFLKEMKEDFPELWARFSTTNDPMEALHIMLAYENPKGYSSANPQNTIHYKERVQKLEMVLGQRVKPDWYNKADLQGRTTMENYAEAQKRKLNTEFNKNFDNWEYAQQNIYTEIAATGQTSSPYAPDAFTEEDYIRRYGDAKGSDAFAQHQSALSVAETIFALRDTPTPEIKELMSAPAPEGGEDFVVRTRQYEAEQKAYASVLESREADSTGYLMRYDDGVKNAWQGVQSGLVPLPTAMDLSYRKAIALGIEKPNALPTSMVGKAVEIFNSDDASDKERMDAVTQLLFASSDPNVQEAVLDQLVANGMPETIIVAARAAANGTGGFRHLMMAMSVDPDKIGNVPLSKEKIEEKIQNGPMNTENGIADIELGVSLGSISANKLSEPYHEMYVRSVKHYMLRDKDVEDAIEQTTKDMFGERDAVVRDNIRITVPSDAPREEKRTLINGLENLVPTVEGALYNFTASMVDPLAQFDENIARVWTNLIAPEQVRSIVSEGMFVPTNGGYNYILPMGMAVPNKDGSPMLFTSEMIDMANMGSDVGAEPETFAPLMTGPQMESERNREYGY